MLSNWCWIIDCKVEGSKVPHISLLNCEDADFLNVDCSDNKIS